MTKAKRTQSERSEATRAALIAAARPLFADRGYNAVGAEEIVSAAGVTRGALYHHFDGKAGLLEAVYEQEEIELTAKVVEGAMTGSDPISAMKAGAAMFLEACMEPGTQRIVLLDAPAVLGWKRWREISFEHGFGVIEAVIGEAIEAGQLAPQPVKPLAHVLFGALDESAMMVARADDPQTAKTEATQTLNGLLDALATMGRP